MAKGKVKKVKDAGHGPKPLKPRPSDELVAITPPQPVEVEPEQSHGVTMGLTPMITYVCQFEGCDLPNREFTRPRRGGRTPKYCSDAHRSKALYNAARGNGTTGPSTKRETADSQLLQLLFKESKLTVDADGSTVKVPAAKFDVPSHLIQSLVLAIRRANEEAPEQPTV